MFQKIWPQVSVAIITAVILGALALIGNFATSGGLVKALGGVPRGELVAELRSIPEAELEEVIGHPHPPPPAPVAAMPKDAVVAFDDDSCPQGWSRYVKGHGRMVVGATENAEFVTEYRKGSDSKPLSFKKFGEHGGQETVTLTEEQMPSHVHALQRIYAWNFAYGSRTFTLTGRDGPVEKVDQSKWTFSSDHESPRRNERKATEATGGGQSHPNMPPYIALYFCKKD